MDFHFLQALERTRTVVAQHRGSGEGVWDDLASVVEDLHDRMTVHQHDGQRLDRAEAGADEEEAVAALMALDDRPSPATAGAALEALRSLAGEIA